MTGSGAKRIVLDTSAYSQARRGNDAALTAMTDADVVLVPVSVLGELEAGFRVGNRYKENRRALDELLGEPYVHVLDVTEETARRYGEVFESLKRAGTPIPVNDIWIAASTLESGAHLITFDADFQQVDSLAFTLLESPAGSNGVAS